jgi:peroxiredoxin
MRSDMVPGAIFPDYELSDHTAKHRKLSELQAEQPMVLVLSRGSFCPKDRRQAEGLLQLHREMEVGYCRLVTISTDNLTQTNENRNGIGAHWPFLSDPRRIVQKDLDIAEYTDAINNPMIPHVIVLEPGLVIHKIYDGYWFFGRPTMEELRLDLRAVSKKCRPDWNITTPELKAAWQQGVLLSLRQDLSSNARRTGLASHSYVDMTGIFRTLDRKLRDCIARSEYPKGDVHEQRTG